MGVVVFGKTEEHKDRFLSDRMGGWFWETEEHKDRFLRAEWRWVFGETEEHKDRFFEGNGLLVKNQQAEPSQFRLLIEVDGVYLLSTSGAMSL